MLTVVNSLAQIRQPLCQTDQGAMALWNPSCKIKLLWNTLPLFNRSNFLWHGRGKIALRGDMVPLDAGQIYFSATVFFCKGRHLMPSKFSLFPRFWMSKPLNCNQSAAKPNSFWNSAQGVIETFLWNRQQCNRQRQYFSARGPEMEPSKDWDCIGVGLIPGILKRPVWIQKILAGLRFLAAYMGRVLDWTKLS